MTTAGRRIEEKERRRREIIDAAEEVFAEVGFDAATMQQIARHARLSRALVYLYFKDKAELQFAIAERAGQQLTQRFTQAAARHRKGLEQIIAIGRAFLAFAQEFPVYFNAIAMVESLLSADDPGSRHLEACRQGQAERMSIMVAALERGMEDETIRPDIGDPLVTALALWGFMHGIIRLSTARAGTFARESISAQQLGNQALQMARQSLRGDNLPISQ
ncbi:MAG: TetR/AcrR family transcriptional regulator [Steroidobacteraceae bacterium]